MEIQLQKTKLSDLEHLFVFQTDEKANYLAAFTPKDPKDKQAYLEKWTRIVERSDINMQTIWIDHKVVGSIIKFVMEGDAEISYWIDRQHWGKGIATQALNNFLEMENTRPLFGRVAFDNYGSQKVLEKCGFQRVRAEIGFANAREKEIEEFVFQLTH